MVRTRKVSSGISNKEVEYFVETAKTTPWVSAGSDLADASPDSSHTQLFTAMTDRYWHFGESAPAGVSFAKISKVLHLKQPALFPILDSHIAQAYAPFAKKLRQNYPDLG
ncbi:DUF6308 family protein [Paenarthrobacter aromaticivorans]|uniref:DUF6308 family protein n=1 Tax=Paenarthrobacter aromaticivorans TaxID=2849150 RepID=UPI003A7FEDC3